VRVNPVLENGVRQTSKHRGLDSREQFAYLGAECRESENPIGLRVDQHLHKAVWFGMVLVRSTPAIGSVTNR
jgi:hypothetical protein